MVRKSAAWIERLADIAPFVEPFCYKFSTRSTYHDYALSILIGRAHRVDTFRPTKAILLPIAAVLLLLYSIIHPAKAYGGSKPIGPYKPLTSRRPHNRGPPDAKILAL